MTSLPWSESKPCHWRSHYVLQRTRPQHDLSVHDSHGSCALRTPRSEERKGYNGKKLGTANWKPVFTLTTCSSIAGHLDPSTGSTYREDITMWYSRSLLAVLTLLRGCTTTRPSQSPLAILLPTLVPALALALLAPQLESFLPNDLQLRTAILTYQYIVSFRWTGFCDV